MDETTTRDTTPRHPQPDGLTSETIEEVNDAGTAAEAEARAIGAIPQKWDIADYYPTHNSTAGAAKLADSAVAPLVAMARGYETVADDAYPDAAKRYALPARNNTQGRRLAECADRGDLLIMPWFAPDDVELATRAGTPARHAALQIRPSKPGQDKSNKDIKYEFILRSPIDLHPGTPVAWIDSTPVVLVAEGLLKGDSALTGYLLAHGATREELSWTAADATGDLDQDIQAARARLSQLLGRIPAEDRILILNIGGVYNWQSHHEWRVIELAGRTVWLGIDADVADNYRVWDATKKLWTWLEDKRKVHLKLLAPRVQGTTGGDAPPKAGLDDYLADHGDWNSLVAQLSDELPPRPTGSNVEYIGQYRMNESGTTLQICEPVPDPYNPEGPPAKGVWKDELPLGGRILSIISHRSPSTAEMETGFLDESTSFGAIEEEVEIEIAWPDGNPVAGGRHVVVGPAGILNYGPDQWARHDARIPAAVLQHPEWPPRGKDGEAWLKALKGHDPVGQRAQVSWETMGWVPTPAGRPAFIVGDQIIGEEDNADTTILAGVDEEKLAGASRFGVGDDLAGDLDDPDYRAQVRRDIELTIRYFVTSQAWTDRRVASAIVASALRPALPVRPAAVMYLVGPPRKGKSWSAAMMMGFWSRNPGDFTEASLPGSVKDTPAAMETSVARSPIWVIDDLAPSTSRQRAEDEQTKIEDLVRNVHNGVAKRRNTINMSSRRTFPPRALLVITAENPLGTGSAEDRTITLDIGHGALNQSRTPTDDLSDLCYYDGAPARVTQALIRYLRWCARHHPDGWAGFSDEMTQSFNLYRESAVQRIKELGSNDNATRHAKMASDIAVTLEWLHRLATHVGASPETTRLLMADEMVDDIFSLVASTHIGSRNATPGHDLLEAIATVLYRGQAHIRDALTPSMPPVNDDTSTLLGWDLAPDDRSRGRGDVIGRLVNDPKFGDVIYFDQKAAFAVAAAKCPELVRPGTRGRTSWASLCGEGFSVPDLRRTGADGALLTTGRYRGQQAVGDVTGTPVKLSTLLARGERDEEDDR